MKRALVIGSAACLWEDVEAALDIGEFDAVIAAKQAGIVWPGELYSWVSLHPDWMMDYAAERRANGYPDAREIVAHEMRPGITRAVNHRWPEQASGRSGASGMFAVKVALEAGFERIVLAGIPMEQHIDRIDGRKRWHSARRYQEGIRPAIPRLKPHLRSVSGWTQMVFGRPTPAWLQG